MENIKLIALDMDGTTLNSDNKISPENKKWIHKAMDHGVMVMFATGRGIETAAPYHEKLGLNAPMVLLNGGQVWDAEGDMIVQHSFDIDIVKKLRDLILNYDAKYWGYTTAKRIFNEPWQDEFLTYEWLKMGISSEEKAFITNMMDTIKNWGTVEVTSSWSNNLEINPAGVTKAAGVQIVCELLDIDMSEVMAIGDSLNDYSLFEVAGLSIAVANARDELKAIAHDTTAEHNEDGVAKAIQKHIFG